MNIWPSKVYIYYFYYLKPLKITQILEIKYSPFPLLLDFWQFGFLSFKLVIIIIVSHSISVWIYKHVHWFTHSFLYCVSILNFLFPNVHSFPGVSARMWMCQSLWALPQTISNLPLELWYRIKLVLCFLS